MVVQRGATFTDPPGGTLPGGLQVKRRAPGIYKQLIERQERALADPLTAIIKTAMERRSENVAAEGEG